MNKRYTYIAMAAITLLASCSQETVLDNVTTGTAGTGICCELPEPSSISTGNDEITRSSLTYDNDNLKMKFSWDENDRVGVYPTGAHSQQQEFVISSIYSSTSACFKSAKDGVTTLERVKEYIAYTPFISNASDDYKVLPVSYAGQTATAFPKLGLFYKGDAESIAKYKESEKAASAHLNEYDYCVSSPTTTSERGNCNFVFDRVGVVTRFFFKSPSPIYYDSLQLIVQRDAAALTQKGTLNAEDKTVTATSVSHCMSLKFSPALDMTDQTSDYYDTRYNGYIVSYLMLAPVDLLGDDTKVYVYLIGHDESGTKKYFKSQYLEQANLTSNMFYQWRSADNTGDAAIVFDKISVQDWENDVSYGNGNKGTGTSGW